MGIIRQSGTENHNIIFARLNNAGFPYSVIQRAVHILVGHQDIIVPIPDIHPVGSDSCRFATVPRNHGNGRGNEIDADPTGCGNGKREPVLIVG